MLGCQVFTMFPCSTYFFLSLLQQCINCMTFNKFLKQAIDGVPFLQRIQEYSNQTNWSNGEVVQRGTGSNYGQDGFLRPGFSYKSAVDYLHSKIMECRETAQDLGEILSRDWKTKFAASFVPRGLELNDAFLAALRAALSAARKSSFIEGVISDKRIADDITEGVIRVHLATVDPADFLTSNLAVSAKTKRQLADPHVVNARLLRQVCEQIIEHSVELHLYNKRISSELENQPKPVDSIVDDFAVEAQSFANSLAMAVAFSAGALAFRVIHTPTADIVSALLGFLNIGISFGTMTNVGRYKIRNEESRIAFMDDSFPRVKKSVFALMHSKSQRAVPYGMNPLLVGLDKAVAEFRSQVKYYGYDEPTEFKEAYLALKSNIADDERIEQFQKKLVTKFAAQDYQENSYVQEALVEVYRAVDEMSRLVKASSKADGGTAAAKALFDRLCSFESKLEASLQRGAVRLGFVKQRKLRHWDIVVAARYFIGLFWVSNEKESSAFAPVETEIHGILKQIRSVSIQHQLQVLRREIRDVEALYWATRESDTASLIFLASFVVFVASGKLYCSPGIINICIPMSFSVFGVVSHLLFILYIIVIFTIARIFSIDRLEMFAFWALAASALGAILATSHFVRKLKILLGLWTILGSKVRQANTVDDKDDIRMVRSVTATQLWLTVLRLVSASTAAIALPWAVAEQGFDSIGTPADLPFYVALVSLAAAIASTFFFFVVEYRIRYALTPTLGPFVCESFRDEIKSIHEVMTLPPNNIAPSEVQEREAWEYTAREFLHAYRFDTVFASERYGSILQYIQGGLEPRNDFV